MTSPVIPLHTIHTVGLESIRAQVGFRNTYVDLAGMPVIHRVLDRRSRVDEAGDVINEGTFLPQPMRLVCDLSEYYQVLAAFQNATSENSQRLRVSVRTDSRIMAGDRILFTHALFPAVREDKEWYVADVKAQVHSFVVSKFALLVPQRDV
jgi:hypothetical protein